MKRILLTLCAATAFLLTTVPDAHARCGDAPGDAAALAATRAEIQSTCGCPITSGSRAADPSGHGCETTRAINTRLNGTASHGSDSRACGRKGIGGA